MFGHCIEMMQGMGGMMGGGMMSMMLLGTLLVGMAVVVGLVLLVRPFLSRTDNRAAAFNILRERYARGEIDLEEYQQRQSILRD